MADFEYFETTQKPDQRRQAYGHSMSIANWLGALCSLVLVIGFAVWAVQLVLRDVTDVPVIRAMTEPMRVQPDDPGGAQMAYQGLSVNEIRAGGVASDAPDTVTFAPTEASLAVPESPVTEIEAEPAPSVVPEASPVLEPVAPISEPEQPAAVSDATPTPDASSGITRSLRPVPRPGDVVQDTTTSELQVQITEELSAENVAPGTRLVQLGAFDDPDTARREWDKLFAQFGDYMVGKKRVIMQATSSGRQFYRLRVADFDTAREARQFCSAFLARNVACIPVVAR